MSADPKALNTEESSVNFHTFLMMLLAMTSGLLLAVMVLPKWVPGMAWSLTSEAPRAYWYLARASAFASLSLLWISMMLGLGITNKMARLWPGAPAAFAIHEYVNLLGLAFAAFHALILLGDHYIGFTIVQLLVPFSTGTYRPLWVGMGQLGFYLWGLVTLSFYVRKGIGQKTWRLVHYLSFVMYLAGLLHGIFSGTDAGAGWVQKFYWLSGGSLIFLLMYRVLASLAERLFPAKKPAPAARPVGVPVQARNNITPTNSPYTERPEGS